MNGIINILKPVSLTSFAVVSRVRKLTGVAKAGHGGTLDPLASGVLPVFLGKATRLTEYLLEYRKTYRALVQLGVETDSFDAEGVVTKVSDASGITLEGINASLNCFRGEISQKPPLYSAVKIAGKPLYKKARAGETAEIESRRVVIYRLEAVSLHDYKLDLVIECSKGTYIRSLAYDLGRKLGCGAHIAGLVRTSYGPFDIKQAVTLEQLEESVGKGTWAEFVQPMDCVLSSYPKIVLDEEQSRRVANGLSIKISEVVEGSLLRAYDRESCFLALLVFNSELGTWSARKVFNG